MNRPALIIQIIFIVMLVHLMLLSSCQNKPYYEQYQPLKISGWGLHDTLTYKFNIMELNHKYNLYLNIRHRDVFEYQNFYIKIMTKMPDGTDKYDIISIPLSEEDGTWHGTCSGDICFVSVPIFKRFRFEQQGEYQIRIKHEMRINELKDLTDLGLKLEIAPPRKKGEPADEETQS